MEALFGVTASSGLPSAPRSEGPEARAKHLHQNLWESPGVSGQRPSSEPPTALPSPVGAPGQPPAPLLSSWPERVLGWNCRKDGQVGVTGAPSFSMRVVRVATLLSEGVSPAAVRVGRHPDVTGRGGLKVARNVAGICSGALSSPSPGRGCQVWAYPLLLSLFGALQVIRLRHKGGCGPLAATRLLQRETMASRKAGTRGKAAATKQAQRGSSNVFSMFEQAQIQEFKEAFSCIDQNRDGIICKSDLRETYSQLGKVNVPEEELDAMLQEGKGPINFTVFLTLFGEKLNGTDPEEAILSAFRLFDPSGKGVVNRDEFKQLLLTQADKFSLAEVEQMFALTPTDLAGNIDYKSLCYIITHGDEKEE
ncbi:myosin regulatory light chain 2, atrial isoform isoform X2 [Balaenoptera acutorostrata]|uniref:Myosin regulatory light chain 2, atrial isoform isoform X2 n=1 Tax=Balaenoptera acutorostrata TaxID=9767 RepID=A0A384AKC9_BALAC|nr:myosin regulatory light chain 2, atrial isoform isoform X2 [Balaenoptera acutorostrata]